MHAFTVRDGLHVEEVGDTVLVLDPVSLEVLELRGDQAEAFRLARAGADLVPDRLATPMAGLVTLGLVSAPGWNRRRVLLAGGAVAAAAVVAIALPGPAAAQSTPGGGGPGPTTAPPGPTVPAAPTITSIRRNFGTNRIAEFVVASDGGSPVTTIYVYVNGVRSFGTGGPASSVSFPARAGAAIQLSLVNAIGESPLSAPFSVPG